MVMFRKEKVSLPDLARDVEILDGLDCEDCEVVGPAVLAPMGEVEFQGNRIGANSILEIFWVVPTDHKLQGLIGLRNSRIVGCRLSRVSVVGGPENVKKWTKDHMG